MAPPGKDKDKDKEKEKEKEKDRDDDHDQKSEEADTSTTASAEEIFGPPSPTDIEFVSKPYHPGPPPHLPGLPQPPGATGGGAWPLPGIQSTPSPTWTTYRATPSPYPDNTPSSLTASLSPLTPTNGAAWPTQTQDPGEGGGGTVQSSPGDDGMAQAGMYAAAAVTPVIVLVLIAAIVFLCMRKRKRQRHEVAVAEKVEDIKTSSQTPPVVQAYMAPLPGALPQYANHLPPTNPASTQPIILGPIPSGSDGAYFTGIDTSDVISMTSTNNFRPPPNPFSDNESLSEPPPPYRPRSVAPPSFTNSSRHSSVRARDPPGTSSQTHLIERSPFDDPDDDTVSEMSGPTEGNIETLSAVSDLSYQNEPVVSRPAI